MSLKISAEDVIPCVYRFLLKYGHSAAAKALEKSAEVEPRGGISTKKLLKICKFYLKHHPELAAKDEEEEEEEEEEVKPVKSKKAEKSLNSKRKPTKEIEEEESEEEEKPVKESKKKIKTESTNGVKARKQSKTIEEESEEEEEETTKKSQKNKVKEEAPIKEKSAADGFKPQTGYLEEEEEEDYNKGRFQYVDHSVLNGVPTFLQDNTFESKHLYGNGGDAFGQFGHERLIQTRGKGFTKEKNKLKNKQFHGGSGRINAHVTNSIKLSYDD